MFDAANKSATLNAFNNSRQATETDLHTVDHVRIVEAQVVLMCFCNV